MPNKSKGFTVVEVMIVLAIAGLIILIIFYAVPSLRRNSNNHSRRNDAARLAALAEEYIANHQGQPPLQFGTGPNQLDVTAEQWAIVNPPQNSAINAFPTANYGDLDNLIINLGFKCTAGVMSNIGGNSFAIGFMVETSGDPQSTCLQG